MNSTGNHVRLAFSKRGSISSLQPPAQIPAKGKYMMNDLTLLFEYYGMGKYQFPNKCVAPHECHC